MLARTAIRLVLLAAAVAAPFGCLALVGLDENPTLIPEDPAAADGGTTDPDSAGDPCPDAECCTSADCPIPDEICITPVCIEGRCDQRPTAAGLHSPLHTPGDCKGYVCDGNGNGTETGDQLDLPDAGSPCSEPMCEEDGGMIINSLDAGSSCSRGDSSTGVCSPSGECVPSSCDNGLKDGNESDIDCGGPCVGMCEAGESCQTSSDCISGICTSFICN